ncbi:MAG: polysaccharide biosynthesis tyrosine autokinase, partial [Muribaculaceae bacterium]|nr:polysaccharide biosynthesis tyrosine autokinase [Muribaculaceae bacterium]
MQNQDINSVEKEEAANGISMRDFFETCYRHWYWFIISIIACTSLAFLFAQSQTTKYKLYAYILIKSDEKSGNISENSLFADMGIGNPSQAVENEIYIIKSTQLLEQVVNRLNLDVTYFVKPLLRKVNIYKKSPIELRFLSEVPDLGLSMEVELKDDNVYEYSFPKGDDDSWYTAKYGDKITSSEGVFIVTKTPNFTPDNENKYLYLSVRNPRVTAEQIWDKLAVKKADKETNVLELTIDGNNYEMCCDLLDNLIDVYNQDVINVKNRVAKNTELFIFDRITSLTKDLGGIDGQIEKLKIQNNIPDLASAAGKYVDSGEKYYDNIAAIETQLSLVKYIKDYLNDDKNKNGLIPANIGIADLGIDNLIIKFNEESLKLSKLVSGSGADNPWVKEQEKTLRSLHANILRSVDNLYGTLAIKKQQATLQENVAKQRISSVPTQEKEINDVLRQQKIKEELYLYLLNKREENALKLAITEPNAKVIEKAGGEKAPIYPITRNILLIGFMIGLIIPAGIIYLIFWIYSLDKKIHSRRDVEVATSLTVIGEIPRKKKGQEDQEIIVTETGKDRISEAMRMVRSNLEYVAKSEKGGVVMQFTSTMPGEGKSYIAINLALSFAHMGKKVLAIDLDLRKGKFSKIIGTKGHKGISAYLSGKIDDLDLIINHGELHPNMDTIGLGAIPPNPANLIMSRRFDELIDKLKQDYDYIFLDTVPYNVIADAALINRKVDTTIYIIRDNKVDKRFLPEIEKMSREEKAKNLCVLLTDIDVSAKRYGYGYGYG